MRVVGLPTPGLGDTTWLLTHEGRGVLVDPQRDVDRFLRAAADAGARIDVVVETHVHNDYVSGAPEAARRAGAALLLPAAAGAAYPHELAFHGEDVDVGDGLVLRPVHTPGHTPEHTSYLAVLDGRVVAVFSGGSLLAGAAGRTDLLGPGPARQLAIAQHGSVRRLAALDPAAGLHPTHGAGSFCSSGAAGRSASTVGRERQDNPVLRHADPETFADAVLAGVEPYPRYYAAMGPLNRSGPQPLPPPPPRVGPEALAGNLLVVDARPCTAFAAGHWPGSYGIELSDAFASWVGWLLPFDAPLVLVLDPDQDDSEAVTALARIGFDSVSGVLQADDLPPRRSAYRTVDAPGFAAAMRDGSARQILDVRAPSEWVDGSVDGALMRYLPDLVDAVPPLDASEPVWVGCASGMRATAAASLLERAGYEPVVLAGAGIPDVAALVAGGAGRTDAD